MNKEINKMKAKNNMKRKQANPPEDPSKDPN